MSTFAVLNPKGLIALQERDLIIAAVTLMLVIVIPVYIFTFYTARKYRAGNADKPANKKESNMVIFLWWAMPACIIAILALLMWDKTHLLDPYKPITSSTPGITIQVVALPWKWLFIYPEQNIAAVNFMEVPVNTPIHFELTADNAPMNSFWIPQLGGQMYAMTSMSSQLNLIANEQGDYAGSAAEVNGAGFSGMRFTARAASKKDFDYWLKSVQGEGRSLSLEGYTELTTPSENNPVQYYSNVESGLYSTIMAKYMASTTEDEMHMNMTNMPAY